MPDNKKNADALLQKTYEENYISVYRYALSKLKNDTHSVDDVVQETFIVLYKKFLAGEEIAYIKAFLFKTADNFVKKKYLEIEKKNKTVSIDEVLEIPSQDEDIDDRLTFEEYSRQISEALSDSDAKLFSLRYIEELKVEEVAKRMNLSISATTSKLFRLRNKLMKMISNYIDNN